MYGKHFASMYTGSMFGRPALVFAVMGYVIANQRPSRRDGTCSVELNPMILAPMFSTSIEEVVAALDVLVSPDPASRTEDEDGRRLILETGVMNGPATYRVVNGKKYRGLRDEEARREQTREAVRRHRARDAGKQGKPRKPRKAHAEAEAEAEAEADQTREDALPPPPLFEPESEPEETGDHEPFAGLQARDVALAWVHASAGQVFAGGKQAREAHAAFGAMAKTFEREAGDESRVACWAYLSWLFTAPDGPVRAGRLQHPRPWSVQPGVAEDLPKAREWFCSLPPEERESLMPPRSLPPRNGHAVGAAS
jgi:hypothetical protein